jgi:hypothetical protein
MEFDPTEDKKYVQPMERDIQARLNETRASMMNYEEGSDEHNRLSDHATELSNALTEIQALRDDKENFYKINFGGTDFSKEAGGGYSDAAGSLTYGGVNEKGQNVININMKVKYAGTTGTMLHEFKHADQYRTGELGFYVDGQGKQVQTNNHRELERQANYRGDVYSYRNSTGTKNSYKLSGYSKIPEFGGNIQEYQRYASQKNWHYITGRK